jgi:hypothetical protein
MKTWTEALDKDTPESPQNLWCGHRGAR